MLGQACSKSLGDAVYAFEGSRDPMRRLLALFTSNIVDSPSRSHQSFLVPPPLVPGRHKSPCTAALLPLVWPYRVPHLMHAAPRTRQTPFAPRPKKSQPVHAEGQRAPRQDSIRQSSCEGASSHPNSREAVCHVQTQLAPITEQPGKCPWIRWMSQG